MRRAKTWIGGCPFSSTATLRTLPQETGIDRFRQREKRGQLKVGGRIDSGLLQREPALFEPPFERAVQPAGRGTAHGAAEGIVIVIDADGGLSPERDEIEADAVFQFERPIVLGHAGQDISRGDPPRGGDVAVFDPERVVLLASQRGLEDGVLYELPWLRQGRDGSEPGLIDLEILKLVDRLEHVAAGAEMIKASLRQRHHRHAQRADLWIGFRWAGAEMERPFPVQIVGLGNAPAEGLPPGVPSRFAHQPVDGPFAEQPDADIDQKRVIARPLADGVGRGFLQKGDEPARIVTVAEKDTEAMRLLRLDPEAEKDHVSIRNRRQRVPGSPNQDVAAGDHHAGRGRRRPRQFPEGRHDQVEERLVEPMSVRPAKHRDRNKEFPGRGVGRQATAFATTVNDQLSGRAQPFGERGFARGAPSLFQDVGGGTAGPELPVGRVERGKGARRHCGFTNGQMTAFVGRQRKKKVPWVIHVHVGILERVPRNRPADR